MQNCIKNTKKTYVYIQSVVLNNDKSNVDMSKENEYVHRIQITVGMPIAVKSNHLFNPIPQYDMENKHNHSYFQKRK